MRFGESLVKFIPAIGESDVRASTTWGSSARAPQKGRASGASRAEDETGSSLGADIRGWAEPLFGHSFANVRVHDDGNAHRKAKDLGAHAYTFGRDIYFAAGQYSPGSAAGKRLLAHELTHVMQQSVSAATPCIQRDANSDYTVDQLRQYLTTLGQTGRIRGGSDGDDMAREVVREWMRDLTFELTPQLKILLIREMQDGPTGDEDERAILDLLERSYNDELAVLFGPGGISVDDLDSDMDGDEQDELDAFYEARFEGGKEAVRSGRLQPKQPRMETEGPRAEIGGGPPREPGSLEEGRPVPLLPVSNEGWQRARIQDCMHQSSGVLPGRMGLIAEMDRNSLVREHFTETELSELEGLIRANSDARLFVCTHGLPGLLAVAGTRSGQAIDLEAARRWLDSPDRRREVRRPYLRSQREAAEEIGAVTSWARGRSRTESAGGAHVSMTAIVGLPEEHQRRVERVLALLDQNAARSSSLQTSVEGGHQAAERLRVTLRAARDSQRLRRSGRVPYDELSTAETEAEALLASLRSADRIVEIEEVGEARSLKNDVSALTRTYRGELSDEQRGDVRDQLQALAQRAAGLRDRLRTRAHSLPSSESFTRVRFLLTYFLSMNVPGRADTSTTEERARFAATYIDIDTDLRAVFGVDSMPAHDPLELWELLGFAFGKQMGVRNAMEQALGQDPGAVPGMQTVRDYFRSLRGSDVNVITRAYSDYAHAYFEHRGLASPAELNFDEFSDLFDLPFGIGGTRQIVCAAFARLGAQLLEDAGGRVERFVTRFHVTQEDIAAQSFSDGHMVARVRFGGRVVWVSNQSIYDTLERAMNVAWAHPDAPSYEGTGATQEAAKDDLLQHLPHN